MKSGCSWKVLAAVSVKSIPRAWIGYHVSRDDVLQLGRHFPHLFGHSDDGQKLGNLFAVFRAERKCFQTSSELFHFDACACFADEAGRNI